MDRAGGVAEHRSLPRDHPEGVTRVHHDQRPDHLPPLIVAALVARLAAGETATTQLVVPAALTFLG